LVLKRFLLLMHPKKIHPCNLASSLERWVAAATASITTPRNPLASSAAINLSLQPIVGLLPFFPSVHHPEASNRRILIIHIVLEADFLETKPQKIR
jgi:hypothetical protein